MGVCGVVFLCPNTSHHGNKLKISLSCISALVLDFFFHSKRRKSYFSVLYIFLACYKDHDQGQQVGQSLLASKSQFSTDENQTHNSRQKPRGGSASYWLPPHCLLSFSTMHTCLPGWGISCSKLYLLLMINIIKQENASQHTHRHREKWGRGGGDLPPGQ